VAPKKQDKGDNRGLKLPGPIDPELAERLVEQARSDGVDLVGPGGLYRATVERLTQWRAEIVGRREEARSAWVETGFIAITGTGEPVSREQFARAMKRLCETAGIEPPVTPCELRHSAISHQADAGHTSWEIANWAGTSVARISSTYRHQLRKISSLRPIGLKPEASS